MAGYEEDWRYKTMYQHPVQSTESRSGGDAGTPVPRTEEVVVGSLFAANSSLSSACMPAPKGRPVVEESTAFGSFHGALRNVNSPSPVTEVSETTPLIMPPDEQVNAINSDKYTEKKTSSIHCNARKISVCSCIGMAMVLSILVLVAVVVVLEYRSLKKSQKTSILQNKNDTIVVAQVDAKRTSKVSLQLVLQQSQPLHVVNLYSTLCSKLRTHSSVDHSSANFTIHGAVPISFPAYLTSGSRYDVASYVLNTSLITVEIELYVFRGLSMLKNFAANLENSVYRATIYISGSGVQNTSTFVNYTVPTTDYYFLVVDSTASVYAQFDVTVNRKYYDQVDYKQSCVIQDKDVCELSYGTSFHNKQECILAHVVEVPDVQWVPADIKVTEEPQRNTETTVVVVACVGGFCVLSLISITFCGFFCLHKRSQRKGST